MIYKICQRAEWHGAMERGQYTGSPDDERDGFVHFSTAGQLAGTLAKHFAGQTDLVLVGVDENRLGSALRWEPSKGEPSKGTPSKGPPSKGAHSAGQDSGTGGSGNSVLYPHLYGVLEISVVEWVRPIGLDDAGGHIVPDGLF